MNYLKTTTTMSWGVVKMLVEVRYLLTKNSTKVGRE